MSILKLTLPLPLTQNHIWKQRRGGQGIYLSEEGREVKQGIAIAAIAAIMDGEDEMAQEFRKILNELQFSWLRVSILYHLPDKRRRDLNNLNKLLLDGISEGIGVDDSRFLVLEQPPCYDKARPRCEVIVTSLTEAQADAQRAAFKEAFEG